ncbi:tyrosine-type recombinase/integrase [uncultured Methanobrevibacter sp.]|uniref:tyrosine-type recombinase/integrase n=1 Tax=uncultured Methanobrevibacter sp. TaxID=253161 RepID=UPI0025E400D2|nr:tyrosine-type recombinase/integrase [uncultured Methanobrevibacter sp.]
MSKYNITEDKLFQNFIRSKPNIAEKTKTHYISALTKFHKSTNEPLETIINKCKTQQDRIIEKTINIQEDESGNKIVEKQIISFDINSPDSHINNYINTFINYCKQTQLSPNSINNYLILITAVLSFYNIQIPTIEKLDKTQPKWNLLTKEDFKFIMLDASLIHSSLIKFLQSTGMRLTDALSLTWGDFMKATSKYHNCITLEEFVEKAPQDMIGSWKFHPNKTRRYKIPCHTFNDPETSNLLLQNLRRIYYEYIPRKNKKDKLNIKLTKDDALFSSKKKYFKEPLQQIPVSDAFSKKNKKLKEHHIKIIDEKIKNGELSIEDRQKAINSIPKFHAHACRKYFETMISKNCGDLRICSLIEGHVSPMKTDPSYIKIDDNDVLEAYLAAIPDLSLENTETKVYTSDVRREMENKISELEKELAVKNDKVDLLFEEFEKFKRSVTWDDVRKEY